MREVILKFNEQFAFKPIVVNAKKLKKTGGFVIAGMGGSHLAGDILKLADPNCDIEIYSDYGLPNSPDKKRLMIFNSYSGNTEETLDGYRLARKKKLPMAAIAVGGKLLDWAKKDGIPYIELPNVGIQPRSALGFVTMALLKLMNKEKEFNQLAKVFKSFKPNELEEAGISLAKRLINKVPVIYCSRRNSTIAYNWKIKFNENAKIPAFYNVFPELNHNEMNGFDVVDSTKQLSDNFYFIFLNDKKDHSRIQKRMEITAGLLKDRGLPVELIPLSENNIFVRIFQSLILADWTTIKIAEQYGLESEKVPMVEEFKKMMV